MLQNMIDYGVGFFFFFNKLTGFGSRVKRTGCVHVHLQVNGQRADTRKNSYWFLHFFFSHIVGIFLQTAQNLHMAGPLDDFSNYLGGKKKKKRKENLFKLYTVCKVLYVISCLKS